jgi:sortase (surface protein transpeptidase)
MAPPQAVPAPAEPAPGATSTDTEPAASAPAATEPDSAPCAPRGNRLLLVAAAVLAAAAIIEFCQGNTETAGPPRPASNVLGKLPPLASAPGKYRTGTKLGALAPLAFSMPTRISIPAVNLEADVITVDVNADGTIGTPSLSNAKVAGWYDRGPAPGQDGAAVMDAHVDSSLMSDYRGAFYYLGLTKPGMQVDFFRADHSEAVFTIDKVQVALKSDFPTAQVYSPTPYASLRLITCGGDFDQATHEYLGNTIVYAHLTAELPGRKTHAE